MSKRKSKRTGPPTIGETIKAVIHERGLTAYAVAKAAGINAAPVQRFLGGERGLTLGTVEKIALALGLVLREAPEALAAAPVRSRQE